VSARAPWLLVLILVLTTAAFAALPAGAHTTGAHFAPWLETHDAAFRERMVGKRDQLRKIKAAKCRPAPEFERRPGEIRPAWRRHRLDWLIFRVERAHGYSSRCHTIPAWPWLALASCESGQRWHYNGSSGFDGGFQFLPSTWNMAKGHVAGASRYAYAWQAPAYTQYRVAKDWQARTSWGQWPVCSAKLGLG
jgi:Transglycosylase-like domain